MLTAKGDEFDRVLGSSNGGRMTIWQNQFSPRELIARIGPFYADLVGQSRGKAARRGPYLHRSGELELDLAGRSASRSGEYLHLTSAEFDLLHAFWSRPDRAIEPADTLDDREIFAKSQCDHLGVSGADLGLHG